jgi:preprotein translocase subunit YajC
MTTLNVFLMSAPQDGEGNPMEMLLFTGVIFIIIYFFFLRPQIKKQKEAVNFRESIKKGNKIVTIGGIHGKVETVKEKTIILVTEGGGKLKIDKSAISANSSASELDVQQNK